MRNRVPCSKVREKQWSRSLPTQFPVSRAGHPRADIEIAQIERALIEVGLHLQHHVILIQLREHGGHFTLAIGVVERLVDGRCSDAKARSRGAIEHQLRLNALRLLIARDIAEFRQLPAVCASIFGA